MSPVLVLVGAAIARRHGFWDTATACLLAAGVTFAHAAVNLFNEWSDHKTGIDQRTRRTPFSGGSGLLQSGTTSSKSVLAAAYGCLSAAALIGFYFCFRSGWWILLPMLAGALTARFYTSHLSRWTTGEVVSGLTLGTLVVAGVYYAMTKRLTWEIIYCSIPPGLLTAQLLFLNEFPDAEADRAGGRRHLVVRLGRRKSAALYAAGMTLVYALIAVAPWAAGSPRTIWLALIPLPAAAAAAAIALKHHDNFGEMVLAQGLNAMTVLSTDILLAAGYLLISTNPCLR